MKKKAWRIGLALAVVGALAAIPASTQGVSGTPGAATSRDGVRLPLLLAVNRLELSKTQMETLRDAIRGVLDERDALEAKRAAFEDEMIAFSGTAAELDSRLAVWNAEMDAARAQLREGAAAAVETLKSTLTMKQGEILLEAFPALEARLRLSAAPEAARTRMGSLQAGKGVAALAVATARGAGRAVMMSNGQMVTVKDDPTTASGAESGVADKLATLVERARDRLAQRLGETEAVRAGCPMMEPERVAMANPISAATSGSAAAEDFGAVTISLGDPATGVAPKLGAGPAVTWLEALLQVLELKLAAMP